MTIMRSLMILLCSLAVSLAANSTQSCKCVPGEPCWPSTSDFNALNNTISGRLVRGKQPASVCYPDQPDYNPSACDLVLKSWFSSTYHAEDPITVGFPWFANNTCPPIYPNGTSVTGDTKAGQKGCTYGASPVYAVNASTPEHVVAAVKFAKKWNIRLNIKSTGHSFQGRSTSFGSLSVWTHYMRGAQWHDNFQADSCPSNKSQAAGTFAAGERDRAVYELAAKHDAVITGGSAQDVGYVGWFTGGGHGPLTSTYGMGVDNILQVKIVTPDGELRTANPCLNPDLFWAIRGGGGGTFGVVTEVTAKAYPSPKVTGHSFSLTFLDPKNETGFWSVLADVAAELPRLKAGGMQGYSFILPPATGVSPYGGTTGAGTWTWAWGFNAYDKPNGTVESLIAPLTKKLDPLNGTSIIYTSAISYAPNFFTSWNASIGDEPVGTAGSVIGSRLIPPEPLTQDPKRLAQVLQNISTVDKEGDYPPILQLYMIANNNTAVIDEVSATPAWRNAVLHLIVAQGFNDSSTYEEAKPVLDRLTYNKIAGLKSLAPESGAYLNEADPYDPNWQYDYWGKNYPRLRSIKKTYDPDSVLWCISCAGNEEWAPSGSGKLCRVPWADKTK